MLTQKPTLTLPILCSLLPLTACSSPSPTPPVEVRYERQSVPASLLLCQAQPPRPTKACDGTYCNDDVANFVIDLGAAGEDCRQKLAVVKGLVAAH